MININRSYPEKIFWDAWLRAGNWPVLQEQYEIARFRVDFAQVVPHRVVIEIDGKRWHCGEDAIVRDLKRERAIKRVGWDMIRFAATDVINNAQGVIRELNFFFGTNRYNTRIREPYPEPMIESEMIRRINELYISGEIF